MPGLIYTFHTLFEHFERDTDRMAKATHESTHAIYSGELRSCAWFVHWPSPGPIDFATAEYTRYDSLAAAKAACPGVPLAGG